MLSLAYLLILVLCLLGRAFLFVVKDKSNCCTKGAYTCTNFLNGDILTAIGGAWWVREDYLPLLRRGSPAHTTLGVEAFGHHLLH
jgi:hypothetical protein